MQRLIKVFLIVILLFASACSRQPLPGANESGKDSDLQKPPFDNAQFYGEKGFSLFYPEDWVLLEEEKVQGSITLRFQEKENFAAQVIVSYFPDAGRTVGEALQQAETLLKGSLFRIKESFHTREENIGGRKIPVIYTRSGERETKIVQTAVITGEKGYIFATLIAREEAKEYFIPVFRLILESIEVQ